MNTPARIWHPEAIPQTQRVLPHNLDAEMGMLGSMLLDPPSVLPLVDGQSEEIFYWPAHRVIFGVLLAMWQEKRPADIITLVARLQATKQLDAIGGPAFITGLIGFTPTAANAEYYLEDLRQCFAQREIITTCTRHASLAYERQAEVDQLQDALEADVLRLPRAGRVEMRGEDPRAGTVAALGELQAIYEGKQEVIGIKLGLLPLDKVLGGARPGQMIVLAARPSVGKSALALQFAEYVGIQARLPVGIFSLEMTEIDQRQRLLLSRSRINLEAVREHLISEGDFQRLENTSKVVADARIYIDDTAGLTISEIRARVRRWHQRFNLRLLVIDYLQLVRSRSRQAENSREREVSEVSGGLKELAKELGLPVVALCQLNRDMERTGREPRLSDLRESGSLEQDADVVLLLHRAEMQAKNDEERAELAGEAKLIVAKQRTGPIGPINLTFRKEFTRFEDRAFA